MNDVIDNFMSDVFSNEYVDNVKKAFSLFEAFEHQNAYSGMLDAINDEGIESIENRADRFNKALNEQLDYVLDQFMIVLTDEATIADKNLILDALFRVQYLEDYTVYENILESNDDSIDKMSRILAELTGDDRGRLLTLIVSAHDRSLILLKDFINLKVKNTIVSVPKELIERLKVVFQVLGKENVGYNLIDAGMVPGYPVELYIPYVENDVVVKGSDNQTAINLLSVLYLADIKEADLITLYREIGEQVFKSVELVGRLESQVIALISKVQELRNITDEKARVLKEGTSNGIG